MMPAFVNAIHRTARKRHTCTECRGDIEPMDIYERVTGCWDGSLSTYKTCTHCEVARDLFVDVTKGTRDAEYGDYCFGEVGADMREAASELRHEPGTAFGLLRHVVGMRQRQRAAIARRKAEAPDLFD
ncbi:MAG: hypothetical protein CMJ75_18995 [Planctomycetaceae bacterium]|nr:hypothetical protein [Planctomycetaceae bacterium]